MYFLIYYLTGLLIVTLLMALGSFDASSFSKRQRNWIIVLIFVYAIVWPIWVVTNTIAVIKCIKKEKRK